MLHVATRNYDNQYNKELGSGAPVTWPCGWPLSADGQEGMPMPNAGFHALTYDSRGFSHSKQAWKEPSYSSFANDLAEIIEACSVGDAIIVGFSMGGGEVACYMSRQADKMGQKPH